MKRYAPTTPLGILVHPKSEIMVLFTLIALVLNFQVHFRNDWDKKIKKKNLAFNV